MKTWKHWNFMAILILIGGVFYANAQDLIILKNGNKIEAKVLEISPTEIRYKRFDHLDGPTNIVMVINVHSIKYENGRTEIINPDTQPAIITPNISGLPTPVQTVNQSDRNPRLNTIGATLGYQGLSAFGFTVNSTVSPSNYTFFDFNFGLGFNSFAFNGRINFNAFVPFKSGGWYAGIGIGGGYNEIFGGIFAGNITTGFIFFNWLNLFYTLQLGNFDGIVNSNIAIGYSYRFNSQQKSATNISSERNNEIALEEKPVMTNDSAQTAQSTTIQQPVAKPDTPAPNGFVYIQGGTFIMGSPVYEPERSKNEVQHQVTVSSFYIGKSEVTQREYQAVMGKNPSFFQEDNLPVEKISWYEAIEYCNKRSQIEGLTPAYIINKDDQVDIKTGNTITVTTVKWNKDANGFRLPTEAEWECACRAGTATPFNTGDNITTNQANYNGYPYNKNANGINRNRTTPVENIAPNAWGLYGMHGNVQEWCWDIFGVYSKDLQTNPMGVSSGTNRVVRGGSYADPAKKLRSAYRDNLSPYSRLNNVGFRLVLPLDQ